MLGELNEIPLLDFCSHEDAINNYAKVSSWSGDEDIKHKKFITLAYSMVLLKNFKLLEKVNPYIEDPNIDILYDYFV